MKFYLEGVSPVLISSCNIDIGYWSLSQKTDHLQLAENFKLEGNRPLCDYLSFMAHVSKVQYYCFNYTEREIDNKVYLYDFC